jgi:hypothetical protein
MGKLIRLLRLNLSPETGSFLRGIEWPPEEMFIGVSFHLSDGRDIRLGADLAKEMKQCLDAAAQNAEGGRAVAPVEVQEPSAAEAIERMSQMLDGVGL